MVCARPHSSTTSVLRSYLAEGPVSYFRFFNQQVVLLNASHDAIELFEKRSAVYSSRPHLACLFYCSGISWLLMWFVRLWQEGYAGERNPHFFFRMVSGSKILEDSCRTTWMLKLPESTGECRKKRQLNSCIACCIHRINSNNILKGELFYRHLVLTFLNKIHWSLPAGTILKLVYGIEINYDNDRFLDLAEALSKITTHASEPGRWLVDSFPKRRSVIEL